MSRESSTAFRRSVCVKPSDEHYGPHRHPRNTDFIKRRVQEGGWYLQALAKKRKQAPMGNHCQNKRHCIDKGQIGGLNGPYPPKTESLPRLWIGDRCDQAGLREGKVDSQGTINQAPPKKGQYRGRVGNCLTLTPVIWRKRRGTISIVYRGGRISRRLS